MITRDEARRALLLYRPGTPDAGEPEIAEALALAKKDPELSRWLEQHCAQQAILREKFRQIPVPAALKEQILSERPEPAHKRFERRTALMVVAAISLVAIGWWSAILWQQPPNDDTFSNYRHRMISAALRDYSMDLESANPEQIRSYLKRQKTAENYQVPSGLQKLTATGCAIDDWQGAKVAMLCFRAGPPNGAKSDVWLFVVDRAAVKGAPEGSLPEFARINKLTTATWTQGGKLYLLGAFGDEQTIRGWL